MNKTFFCTAILSLIIFSGCTRGAISSESTNLPETTKTQQEYLPAGKQEYSLQSNGQKRKYLLHVSYFQRNKPDTTSLIIVLHGGLSTAKATQSSLGFNKYSNKYGFLVAYPDGIDKHWNDGRGTTTDANDVQFILDMIKDIKQKTSIEKVFVTGISNGAMMTYRLLCEAPEVFSGAAPVIGNIAKPIMGSCDRKYAVPTLVINGETDPIVPFDGGECCKVSGKGLGGILVSMQESLDILQKKNICTSKETTTLPIQEEDGTTVEKTIYTCETPLVSYLIKEGGHTWPPFRPLVKAQGKSSQNMDATKTIVEFFLKKNDSH